MMQRQDDPIIRLRGVNKWFGQFHVLTDDTTKIRKVIRSANVGVLYPPKIRPAPSSTPSLIMATAPVPFSSAG